jgi:hypothetical protein
MKVSFVIKAPGLKFRDQSSIFKIRLTPVLSMKNQA